VLLGFDYDYLLQWGHYRLTAGLYERLQGHLDDPWTNAASKNSLGICYHLLGQLARAIELYEQALAIDRETGDRHGEAIHLGNLAIPVAELGQTARAIELHERALAIDRENGDRNGEANHLGNLGNRYAKLGQTARAVELQEQALVIHRETGDQNGQAAALGNLGNRYAELGQTARAIGLYEQGLAISRQIGFRLAEALFLICLGEAHGDLGAWDLGARYCREAADIADAIGSTQPQNEARRLLAQVQLLAGDLAAARQAISAARDHDYPARTGWRQPLRSSRLLSPTLCSSWSRPAVTTRRWTPRAGAVRARADH
jgi:tetratricopeptide (TPR) repeat protein